MVLFFKVFKEYYFDFLFLKEVYREIMEDKMDVENVELFLSWVWEGKIKVVFERNEFLSLFVFNFEVIGLSDVVLMEDRREMIKVFYWKIMVLIGENVI